jgi:hypothetical protein
MEISTITCHGDLNNNLTCKSQQQLDMEIESEALNIEG